MLSAVQARQHFTPTDAVCGPPLLPPSAIRGAMAPRHVVPGSHPLLMQRATWFGIRGQVAIFEFFNPSRIAFHPDESDRRNDPLGVVFLSHWGAEEEV